MNRAQRDDVADAGLRVGAGDVLADRFRLTRLLGRGGVGLVWLAEDSQLDCELVACKLLKPEFRQNRQALSDLKREVLLTRKLRHPNILPVYTFWEDKEQAFVTMEYVDGPNLAHLLADRERPYTLKEILPWVEQLSSALDYAHANHVLHRDVKPANILHCPEGQIQLADFGIARLVVEMDSREKGGFTQGTLYYMSPEQLANRKLDHRSDLYSMAATVYELLSGTPPFHGEHVSTQIESRPAEALAHLSADANDALLKGLSKRPDDRHTVCALFHAELSRACTGSAATSIPLITSRAVHPEVDTEYLLVENIETRRSRLGRLLIQRKIVGQEDLAHALLRQQETGEKLGEVLISMGLIHESQLTQAISHQLEIPHVNPSKEAVDSAITRQFPESAARQHLCIPLRRSKGNILVAIADPLDVAALNYLEQVYSDPIELRLATARQVFEAIDLHYGKDSSPPE